MNPAKIHLSPEELSLVKNAQLILTKNIIIQKVYHIFGSLASDMEKEILGSHLPPEVIQVRPKISRGENFQGLPYAMLDYPRFFTRENIFAVRSFFWWANYFSVTLHLKGEYKKIFMGSIQENVRLLMDNHFYLSISEDEWSHDLGLTHYVLLDQVHMDQWERYFMQTPFLKLSAKLDLDQWNQSETRLMGLYRVILEVLGN